MRVAGRRQQAAGGIAGKPLSAFRFPLSGMTLVELLVVIVLVTTLVTTAIPIMAPGGDRRALRESSRNLNAYLAGAQARAIQTGRPFGVALRRLSADTGRGADNAVCTTVEYVETPPPYAGFDENSLARIGVLESGNIKQLALQLVRHGSDVDQGDDLLPPSYDIDLVPDSYLRPGDEIEVGGQVFVLLPYMESAPLNVVDDFFDVATPYNQTTLGQTNGLLGFFPRTPVNAPSQGHFVFAIQPRSAIGQQDIDNPVALGFNPESFNAGLQWSGRLTHDNAGDPLGSPEALAQTDGGQFQVFWTTPAPYKIHRQPTPAGGEVLRLPTGAAIDLQASGVIGDPFTPLFRLGEAAYDSATQTFRPYDPQVMILFSPDGGIERLYTSGNEAGNLQQGDRVATSIALCVGRRELIPAAPTEGALAALGNPLAFVQPIDLQRDVVAKFEPDSEEAREVTDLYNWLNLDTRWVVIGAQTGSVVTVENSYADPTIDLDGSGTPDIDLNGNGVIDVNEQLAAAVENAPRRSTAGGR